MIRICLLVSVALSAAAQTSIPANRVLSPNGTFETLDGAALAAAQKANPDDALVTVRLLQFYAQENHDPDWTNRFALLAWNIEHHPGVGFPGMPSAYQGMPPALHAQIKQMWIAQVHQHSDDPNVLRNAAAGLDTNTPKSIRVGGNVQSANLLRQVKPAYPPEAQQARIQGTVRYNATIGQDGLIKTLQLVSGHPLLVSAATEAVQQWVYKPTLLNGNPVDVSTTIDVNFTLAP